MQGIKSTFFEEIFFDSMLKSSGDMIATLTSLTQVLDPYVGTNVSILSIIRAIKDPLLKEKVMNYYNRSILNIQNTACFYSSVSSLYNERLFQNNGLNLKDLKVSRIIEIGISLEKMIEIYNQLSEKSLLKKNLAPMIQDVLKVCGFLERLVTLLRPVLHNDKTIAESIALLKEGKLKNCAFNYCDLCNQEVKSLISRYPYCDTPFYESCKNIFMKDPEKITFNTLNQWKSILISHQEGLKINKFDVLSKKTEENKKIVFNDLKDIYTLYHEFDFKRITKITGDEVRSLLKKTEAFYALFEKKYKGFRTHYFESEDYFYVLGSLNKMKNCLNKILDFPLMTFVSSQNILKYYKKTSLKRFDKKEILNLIHELKSLSQDFSSSLEKGLEANNIIKVNQKKTLFKKKKVEDNFSKWLFNKESGFDEKICGNTKLVRDHIHEYKETDRKKVDFHNYFTKVLITKTCEVCGKVENFEKIQPNEQYEHFLELAKRKILKNIDLNIVNLKKLLPRIELRDRQLKEYIKSVLKEVKMIQENDTDNDLWYENENIYFDEPTFRAYIEKPNKISESDFNFINDFSDSQRIEYYEFCENYNNEYNGFKR
ncbi:MAG: hypothetical protein HFJ02_06540 [Bacilli bacterium]|nr:hypothetical protein [Bacilli bacterium]